jgi:hypothetical protein
VSMVSATIGAQLGFAATLLAPACVLLLYTVGRIGLIDYCEATKVKLE